jgi:tetratricopeptide (TPR) repeat protein
VDHLARSPEAERDNAYKMALIQYDQKNYEMAYQLFNDVSEESPPNLHFFLYKGITAMELGDFQMAISSFAHLQSDALMKHEGMWYTGLAYLGMEDIPAARDVFEEIIATGGQYKKEAKKLLKSI